MIRRGALTNLLIIESLPEDIVMDILARLPVKDIYTCRQVCQKWRRLLSNRDFLQLHKQVRPVGFLALSSSSCKTDDFYLMEFTHSVTKEIETSDIKFRTPFKFRAKSMVVSNTCNGFLCFYKPKTRQDAYICNPVINEYVPVPHTLRVCHKIRRIILGFNPTTERYKLLRFLFKETQPSKTVAEVLVLTATHTEREMWRRIDDEEAPSSFFRDDFHKLPSPFWNGAVHQINSRGTEETGFYFDSIVCFDFVSNRFKTLPAPPYFDESDDSSQEQLTIKRKRAIRTSNTTITVLKDFLCVGVVIPEEPIFQVWAMKEYGVKGSWTILLAIRTNLCCRPITLYGDGASLLMWQGEDVLASCVKEGTQGSTFINRDSMVIPKDNLESLFGGLPYSPSFVSLRDVVGPYYKNVRMGRRVRIVKGRT